MLKRYGNGENGQWDKIKMNLDEKVINRSYLVSQNNCNQRKYVNVLPNVFSGIRIVFAGLILWLLLIEVFNISLYLFIVAALTDLLDGALARKLGTDSRTGAYIDVSADFILVFLTSLGLIIIKVFPVWLLILEGLMFGQFILTSGRIVVYDPLGKHYGTLLMAAISVTLWIPNNFMISMILWILVGFTIVCIACRIITHKRL